MNVEPNLKPQVECPCGCGTFGTATRNGHPKGCPNTCPSCRGRRNRQRGKRGERAMRKVAGVVAPTNAHAQLGEEFYVGPFRVEIKAGSQVGPVATRFLAAERQSEQSRPIGDVRPFLFLARPDRMPDGLVVVRGRVWQQIVEPALRSHWGGDAA